MVRGDEDEQQEEPDGMEDQDRRGDGCKLAALRRAEFTPEAHVVILAAATAAWP
jgi:hypothetical protein